MGAHSGVSLEMLKTAAEFLLGPIPLQAPPPVDVDANSTTPGDLVAVHIDRVTYEKPRPAGHIHVGHEFWKRLGLHEILGSLGFSPGAIAYVRDDSQPPHSSRGRVRHARLDSLHGHGGHPKADFSTLTYDPLYRNLDRLYPHRAAIESALAERERRLFNLANTILLYDLTSTYFEGKAALIPKAKRGYSRDHRPDCKQVVVGLVIGREGFPRRA